jgi:ketosteroid isomerase-like protein
MEASSDIQRQNVELTQRGFEAYNSGSYEAVIELLDPEVDLLADHELLNSGSFTGRDGFRRWSAEWLEAWDEFSIEANAVETIGEHFVLVDAHQVARGAGSGIPVEMDVFWAFEVSDGMLVRMHLYASRDRALGEIERWRSEREGRAPA